MIWVIEIADEGKENWSPANSQGFPQAFFNRNESEQRAEDIRKEGRYEVRATLYTVAP